MRALTVEEARQRATDLALRSYDVAFDLTGDGDTFVTTSRIRFGATSSTSWVDVKPERLISVELNGQVLDPAALDGGRFPLAGLQAENEVVVTAELKYSADGEGLVRSVDAADGRVYTYGMSSLESAPRYFPCFDQPDLKAPYTVTVKCPEDWVVLGNGAATRIAPGEWTLTETKPLSTYFVTLVAGPYHQLRGEYDGIPLGLACRQSLKEYLDRDAEDLFRTTREAFAEYHRLFRQRYPFGEYWQVFVPDFNMGAMENPGCVTFTDSLLFRGQATEAERSTRARIVVHEMAHMWFGDLVTMKWWNDMWLNESFAEYMAHRVAEDATSYQGNWVDFAFVRKWWGLTTDQSSSTHPVAPDSLKDARQSLDDFDGISYAKGAAVLKQLAKYLGDDVFLKGVNAHLEAHEYGNADLHEFIAKLTEAGARDLDTWSDQWLRTAGLDTITVERTGAGVVLHRKSPDESRRLHKLSVGAYDADGSAASVDAVIAGDSVEVVLGNDAGVLVPDAGDDTWAKIRLDPTSLADLPTVLPAITDGTTRAVIWNSIRDAVADAELDPRQALELFTAALPHEDSDVAVGSLVQWLEIRLLGRYLDYDRYHGLAAEALRDKLARTAPGSSLQLATARGLIATTDDADLLASWLQEAGGPDGLEIDADLRWALVLRLVRLGAYGATEIDAELTRDGSSEGVNQAARCRAALPDGKEAAWTRIMTDPTVGVKELLAAAEGFWHPAQAAVTAPYARRFFTDIPHTGEIRSGMVLGLTAHRMAPRFVVDPDLIAPAEALIADETVVSGIRRQTADFLDDLRRALAVRRTFG
ncbi:aminopeptidase N [Kribbella sp. VKM Ac-2571]|uniref:aminopeptidase N n=1 Tax=Kribbella sp. VKM Ac-2571 TaxID=2512222 RepID=UPI00105C7E54|nr:aminopeptidase N [Kribbella sp. VKM Ac-2571]TDO66772.1 aminopeptidase N [Kribbella sp. VKM Ac-2571]